MIVGLMQPYFFPYIGYFQLIAATDVFVFHDDVQYPKGGWINRNYILNHGRRYRITFPVLKAAHDRRINERFYEPGETSRARLLRQIEGAYRQAPRFRQVYPLLVEIINFDENNVSSFNINLIRKISEYLRIRTNFMISSELFKDDSLTGQDRVVEICRRLGATRYVNPIGGRNLYAAGNFRSKNIELDFLEPEVLNAAHALAGLPLSIIDSLMCASDEAMAAELKGYRIVAAEEAAGAEAARRATPQLLGT
jgi:WbqC-like protein family